MRADMLAMFLSWCATHPEAPCLRWTSMRPPYSAPVSPEDVQRLVEQFNAAHPDAAATLARERSTCSGCPNCGVVGAQCFAPRIAAEYRAAGAWGSGPPSDLPGRDGKVWEPSGAPLVSGHVPFALDQEDYPATRGQPSSYSDSGTGCRCGSPTCEHSDSKSRRRGDPCYGRP